MPQKIDALIFDLTGTTIDMSRSQSSAVEYTVNRYLESAIITQTQVAIVWGTLGYNNAWDATYGLACLLDAGVAVEDWVVAAQKLLPIDRSTPLFKKLYAIFQTYYLGSELFYSLENKRPPFSYGPGLITTEKSFVAKELLTALKGKGYKLGIATGCPRKEALISLNNLGLMGLQGFEEAYLVGMEDTAKTKPEPDPLLEAKRRLGAQYPAYIGDNSSDIEAARRAGMPCIYVGGQRSADDPGTSLIAQVLRSFL